MSLSTNGRREAVLVGRSDECARLDRLLVETKAGRRRRLLLLAAAEPTGDLALLSRSADELGIEIEAMAPAVGDGMLELGARVAFRA